MIRIACLAALLACVAAPPARAADVGRAAPAFSAPDELGRPHALDHYRGKLVVLEWTNPDCPFVQRHYARDTMEELARRHGARGVAWLAVNSTHYNTPEDTRRWKEKEGFEYPTLQDAAGEIGRKYGALTTPQMFIIDPQGVLRYAGAIDDDPRGNKEQVRNFVDSGLGALLAGEAPSPSSTRPYGCSVKYK